MKMRSERQGEAQRGKTADEGDREARRRRKREDRRVAIN